MKFGRAGRTPLKGNARERVKFGKGLGVAGETRSFRTDLGCPAQIGLQTKGIVLIRPIIADVPADHRRSERPQRRAGLAGSKKLRGPLVGEAVHPDSPIGAGELGRPSHGIGAVCRLMDKKIELAFGGSTAPDILDDYDVTLLGVPARMRVTDGRGDAAAIGLTHQQHRKTLR